MENSELPANPTNIDISEYKGTIKCEYNKPLTGLTKREYFAGLVMQGICSSGPTISNEQIALEAVCMTDALLAELEK